MTGLIFSIAGNRRDLRSLSLLLLGVAGTWSLAGAATYIALPRIAPLDVPDRTATVESLGLLIMAATMIPHLIFMSGDGALVELGARPAPIVRSIRVAAHLLVSCTCGATIFWLLPAHFDFRQLLGVWAGAWGLSFLACTFGPPALATALPAGTIVIFGLPGLIPWRCNAIFNPQHFAVLVVLGISLLLAGTARYSWTGPREDRQA